VSLHAGIGCSDMRTHGHHRRMIDVRLTAHTGTTPAMGASSDSA